MDDTIKERERIIKILEGFSSNFSHYLWKNLMFQISGEVKCRECGRSVK